MCPSLVQPVLATPGDLHDTRVLACLANGYALTDRGPVAVVVSGLDQQPSGVRWPGLGDLSLGALFVRGVLARHHAEEPRQQRWLGEAGEVADFRAQPSGGERVDPTEAAQPRDRLRVAALWNRLLEHADQCAPALPPALAPRIR